MKAVTEQNIKTPLQIASVSDSIVVVRVGTDERPAAQEDIDYIKKEFSNAIKEGESVIFTHHAIDFVVIPKLLIGNVVVKS